MSEPITIQLRATGPLSGLGLINLTRDDFTSSVGDRLKTATIPTGSRVSAELFGFFGRVTVSATTHNPREDHVKVSPMTPAEVKPDGDVRRARIDIGATERVLEATNVGGGAVPLEALVRRFAGPAKAVPSQPDTRTLQK